MFFLWNRHWAFIYYLDEFQTSRINLYYYILHHLRIGPFGLFKFTTRYVKSRIIQAIGRNPMAGNWRIVMPLSTRNTNTGETRAYIQAPSEIRTHGPSVRKPKTFRTSDNMVNSDLFTVYSYTECTYVITHGDILIEMDRRIL